MRISLLFAAVVVAAVGTINTASARAQSTACTSARTSVYGTIQSVRGNTFAINATDDLHGRYIRTTREDGTLLVRDAGARVRSDGLTIRPGVFAGVFGCFSGRNAFNASQVTLSTSLQTYPYRHGTIRPDRDDRTVSRGMRTIQGTVVSNGPGTRVVISTADGRQLVVFTSELRSARVGDRVTATGYINSKGNFQASNARVISRR